MIFSSDPRLYLVVPVAAGLPDHFPQVLDAGNIACIRLAEHDADEEMITRMVERLRSLCHERSIALLMTDHYKLVTKLQMDGVHLDKNRHLVREARVELGNDLTVGVYCGTSRHQAMIAGEKGADYVSFGPVYAPDPMRTGPLADVELARWWSELMEIPLVVEGGVSPERIVSFLPHIDFLMVEQSVWKHPDGPVEAIKAYMNCLKKHKKI